MPKTNTRHIDPACVQCCFYKWAGSRRSDEKPLINCEGLIKGTTESVIFRRVDDLDRHIRLYCCGDFKSCIRAKALYMKYGFEVFDKKALYTGKKYY